jgi:acetyl esterase/lipase
MCACILDEFSYLYMKASVWRTLMGIGFKLHHFAEPKSPKPNFEITIPSRLSTGGGSFKLAFYAPPSYFCDESDRLFPVVVNYHGGGFTLGTERDDARWASAVVRQTKAVVVSVGYRLAPEYPFSVGLEDAADAIIYLAAHAEELSLDPHKIAISGFSAGANFALAVPFLLHELRIDAGKRTLRDNPKPLQRPFNSQFQNSASRLVQSSSSIALAQSYPLTPSFTPPRPYSARSLGASNSVIKLTDLEPTALEVSQKLPDFTIVCIVAFYPPVDFRQSREEKRLTNPQPSKNLPLMLTDLFDRSYIAPTVCDLADPYLSPAAASDDLLRAAYPQDIVLYTCEYDMLNAEGVLFGERLKGEDIRKNVHGGLIKGVEHAFDKKPNPISFPKSADSCYKEACTELNRLFGRNGLSKPTESEVGLNVLRYGSHEIERYADLEGHATGMDNQRKESESTGSHKRQDLSDINHHKESYL